MSCLYCRKKIGLPRRLWDSQFCSRDHRQKLTSKSARALREAEDLYGYEIAKRLQRANQGEALFKEGTIYPVLRALAAGGLLTSRVVPSYAGPARRYYRITDEGRAMLRQWSDIWRQTRGFVDRFIEGTES